MSARKKVVYLFGAGATEAELCELFLGLPNDGNLQLRTSLLLKHVSRRVCREAKKHKWFKRWAGSQDVEDIELFMSLITTNKADSLDVPRKLQDLLKKDICKVLSKNKLDKFYLHKAFFELHESIDDREDLLSAISLNYDNVLDDAFQRIHKILPNYSLLSDSSGDPPFVLKLHGGFDLKDPKSKK